MYKMSVTIWTRAFKKKKKRRKQTYLIKRDFMRNKKNVSANMRQPCKRSLGGRDASIRPGISGDSEFLDGGPVSTGTHHS